MKCPLFVNGFLEFTIYYNLNFEEQNGENVTSNK